ncbi:hypothetical protein [Soonwooa sp.]|uniref:hypothetical protein n=1 Tax=Soonwooa sp. TaxID=1938592 RepID=UPI002604DB4C|nr:hypothetical protein [Soonwooa sp.]
MRLLLQLLFVLGILFSPCSVKASLFQLTSQEDFSFEKTSPNKSKFSDKTTCDLQNFKTKTKVKFVLDQALANDFFSFKNIEDFIFKTKEKTAFVIHQRVQERLFLLYSQLKIAIFK